MRGGKREEEREKEEEEGGREGPIEGSLGLGHTEESLKLIPG